MKKTSKLLILLSSLILIFSCKNPSDIGIVIDDGLILRNNPSITSAAVALLKKGVVLRIKSRGKSILKVGGNTGTWIEVETLTKKRGYVFSPFVFDFSKLFTDSYWANLTYSEYINAFKFRSNGTFSYLYSSFTGERIIKFQAEGKYVLDAKNLCIFLRYKKSTKSNSLIKKFYFFKYRNKHYLTKKYMTLNKRFESDFARNMALFSADYPEVKRLLN
jgi:hypothetical protein